MNKTGVVLGVALLATSFAGLASPSRQVAFTGCEGLDAAGIAASVKRDYLQNRVVKWPEDRKKLGQADPVAWVNASSLTGGQGVWQVPLVVRGKSGDIHYTVHVDCKAHSADYRSE